ncbi:DUF4272 domain-containing protein [Fulvivirga sp. M361]|uniref:DUF4272 domain-containing protein n=1 Tax=Fulvivirga sp. M361 TaxID=2594266 RepID=UPI0016294F91|nr:DUF4272 domain-containing protein [Fulvivirga sp. M361]
MTEQEKRKSRSEKILTDLGSDFIPYLPLIEFKADAKIRTPREIGLRILCLFGVAAASHGVDSSIIIEWLKRESVFSSLSREEKTYLQKNDKSENENFQFSWRSECIWLLLWAIGKVQRDLPTAQCNVDEMLQVLPSLNGSTEKFLESIELRSTKEILDQSDLIYRAHWAIRQYGLDESVRIGNLDPDVVMEWHLAINWLTNYGETDYWDEVTTDT